VAGSCAHQPTSEQTPESGMNHTFIFSPVLSNAEKFKNQFALVNDHICIFTEEGKQLNLALSNVLT
jgi:hypothetical protein